MMKLGDVYLKWEVNLSPVSQPSEYVYTFFFQSKTKMFTQTWHKMNINPLWNLGKFSQVVKGSITFSKTTISILNS